MQRKRKKFSAAFSGISDHPQKMGNGSNSTPQTAPAAKAAPQPGGSLPPPIEAGSRPGPGAERSVRARPPSCRRRGPFAGKAASRRAGQQASQVEESSRPGIFVSRPSSRGNSKKGPESLLGFRLRRKEVGSFFAAACTWRKILRTKRRANRVRPHGAGPGSHQSGVHNHRASAARRWLGISRPNVPRYIWAKFFMW